LSIGLSVLPPPATIPIIALESPEIFFLDPEGIRIMVLVLSSECPITVQKVPVPLATLPLSPYLSSTLEIRVPSGIFFTGRTFPILRPAFSPQ